MLYYYIKVLNIFYEVLLGVLDINMEGFYACRPSAD